MITSNLQSWRQDRSQPSLFIFFKKMHFQNYFTAYVSFIAKRSFHQFFNLFLLINITVLFRYRNCKFSWIISGKTTCAWPNGILCYAASTFIHVFIISCYLFIIQYLYSWPFCRACSHLCSPEINVFLFTLWLFLLAFSNRWIFEGFLFHFYHC